MGRKRKIPDERDEAILLVMKNNKGPIASDEVYAVVKPFFPDRRQFARALGGLTKRRSVFVKEVGDVRLYSLDPKNGDDFAARRDAAKSPPSVEPGANLRIDQLYTRREAAMIAAIRAKKVKPSAQNNPDKTK